MSRFRKFFLSVLLGIAMIYTQIPVVAFAGTSQESTSSSVSTQAETTSTQSSSTASETTPSAESGSTTTSSAAGTSSTSTTSTTVAATQEAAATVQSAKTVIEYVYVDSDTLTSGDTQYIAVGFLDGNLTCNGATLTIESESSGQTIVVQAQATTEGAVLFSADSSSFSSTGTYRLVSMSYKGDTSQVDVAFDDGSEYEFNVDTSATSSLSAMSDDNEVTAYSINDSGELVASSSVADALDSASSATGAASLSAQSDSTPALKTQSSLLVAVDAGHGGNDSGASANGLVEANLTEVIANACAERLQSYGIPVYMVPRSHSDGSKTGPSERVDLAAAAGANVYISIHINETEGATGFEVFVPNDSSYQAGNRDIAYELANKILANLSNLGLPNRGLKTRDSTNGSTYPDGHIADYLSVISQSRIYGMVGVLVEHGFIDGQASDVALLSNYDALRAMGYYDADAIYEQFGSWLTEVYSATAGNSDWTGTKGFRVYIRGTIPDGSTVQIPVWSDAGGQDDIVWYTATRDSSGNYYVDVPLSEHNNETGPYNCHCYIDGQFYENGYTSYTYATATPSCSVSLNSSQTTATATLNSNGAFLNGTSIYFAVWSNTDGQDDLTWYGVSENSDGSWSCDIPISAHGDSGVYNARCYIFNNGSPILFSQDSFSVTQPTASMQIGSYDSVTGSSEVTINAPTSTNPSGVSSVSVAVWSESNQSNIHWYTGKQRSDGTWYIDTMLGNHGYETGTYNIHAYVYDNNGTRAFTSGTQTVSSAPTSAVVTADLDSNEDTATISLYNSNLLGNVSAVSFPVWSDSGGQDDVVWYQATKDSDGKWTASVPISAHGSTGTYQAHCYATVDGSQRFAGNDDFTVTAPTADVKVTKTAAGTYTVTASNVSCISGVSSVSMPTWTEDGWQDDMVWHQATDNGDGTWSCTIPMSDHNWQAGTYDTHCYVNGNNGTSGWVGAVSQEMSLSPGGITVSLNSSETVATVTLNGLLLDASTVSFPVWSESGDQDDVVWYPASQASDGTWTASVPISAHGSTGTYQAHCYATVNGSQRFMGATTFDITAPTADVKVTSVNSTAGTYTVTASNIVCPSNVSSVSMPTWTEDGWQDDMVWYQATDNGDGTWSCTIPMSDHNWQAGTYDTHCYVNGNNGTSGWVGAVSQEMELPKTSVTASLDQHQTTATVTASIPVSGVSAVSFPVWSDSGEQDDVVWYQATQTSDGTWTASVPISAHGSTGTYQAHCYATVNGSQRFMGATTFGITAPTADVKVTSVNSTAGTYTVTASNIVCPSNVSSVSMPTWTEDGWQDDMVWYQATDNGDGTWSCTIPMSDHNWETGTYDTHCYVYGNNGTSGWVGAVSKYMELQNHLYVTGDMGSGTRVAVLANPSQSYSSVMFPVWSEDGNQNDIIWYPATQMSDGSWRATITCSYPTLKYYGNVFCHCYATAGGVQSFINGTYFTTNDSDYNMGLTPIMGSSSTAVDQMVAYYNASGADYPSSALRAGGAGDIRTFCQIMLDEANSEGVRAEVLFAQVMHETGWLQFGGDVKVSQFNFGGLGATGGGVQGASFGSVQEGLLAQVQHLKAYASTDVLSQSCVDSRFGYVTRGCAPYVEWLGQSDNPYGCGWATGSGYGAALISLMNNLEMY